MPHPNLPEPFDNDVDSVTLSGLTIENGELTIAIYGNLDLTKDGEGLKIALQLRDFFSRAVTTLQGAKNLPAKIPPVDRSAIKTVKNPFGS